MLKERKKIRERCGCELRIWEGREEKRRLVVCTSGSKEQGCEPLVREDPESQEVECRGR